MLAGLLAMVGCLGPGSQRLPKAVGAAAAALAGERWQVLAADWRTAVAVHPAAQTCVVVHGSEVAPAEFALDAAARELLQRFVAEGGRLLLFGEASCLLGALGADIVVPEASQFRWGYDARTAIGSAKLGLEWTTSSAEDLLAGLLPANPDGSLNWLQGGTPCSVALARWPVSALRGEVLAQLRIDTDGVLQATREPGLVRLAIGRGEVIASALPLDLEHPDATLRDNCKQLLRNLVGLGKPRAVYWAELPRLATLPVAAGLPLDLAARELPQASQLAYAGWQVGPGSASTPADEVIDQVLLPAWRAGGGMLAIEVTAPVAGLPWSAGDPLPPPAGLPPASTGGWTAAGFGQLAAEAHARGMLATVAIAGPTVAGSTKEQLGALRFLARELACLRRLGSRAVDGLTLQQWPRDPLGIAASLWADYQAGGYLMHAGEVGAPAAGVLRALHGADGMLPGWSLQGLGQGFRSGFPAERFPAGVLLATADEAPDWLVAQAQEFVRARRGQGGALWLRVPDVTAARTRHDDYARALLQEPLVAAVAMPLTGTGLDGQRAAVASLLGQSPATLGALVQAPAATHVLQNNWLRLLGSGGALQWDEQGLGRFDPPTRVLSPGLLRTRFFGGRPDAGTFRTEHCDFLQLGSRPAGGFLSRCEVSWPLAPGSQPPAQLAGGMAPTWPEVVELQLPPWLGYCELRLRLRGTEGATVCQVELDELVLRCIAVQEGHSSGECTVPVHLARSGPRRLRLRLREAGAVAIDQLQLRRLGDVAAEAAVAIAAGSVAELSERSLSSYHQERLELRTFADWPGLLIRSRCDRAVQNLQLERTLCLPGYAELPLDAGPRGNQPSALALRLVHGEGPDLVVLPLQWPRYDRLTKVAEGLQWRCLPEPGTETTLALLFCDRRHTGDLLRHGRAVLAGLDPKAAFELGDRGELTLVADLPVPTTRLLHLRQRAQTPYAVCERGYWTFRGAQPAPQGGDWLRVAMTPGDTVRVRGGPGLLAMTRPAPGSLHLLALRDLEAASATVRVLQPARLTPPGVVFAAEFDEVWLDGAPWACFDGRTVYVPAAPGTYRVATRLGRRSRSPLPHVAATQAPLQQCYYAADERCLVLVTAHDPARPAGLPYTALLRGPRPLRSDNGELVDDASLRFADLSAASAAGVLLRFRPGVTKVYYGDVP